MDTSLFYYFCTKLGLLLSSGKFCTHVFQHMNGVVACHGAEPFAEVGCEVNY